MPVLCFVDLTVKSEEAGTLFEKEFEELSKQVAENEEGTLLYHLCKQETKLKYFILEGYRDQEALNQHANSAYVKDQVAKFSKHVAGAPVIKKLAPVGETIGQSLENLKGKDLEKKMGFVATINIKEGKVDDFLGHVTKQIATVHASEPHCAFYEISQNEKAANELLFFEIYENSTVLKEHGETEYFKKFFEVVGPFFASEPTTIAGVIVGGVKGSP